MARGMDALKILVRREGLSLVAVCLDHYFAVQARDEEALFSLLRRNVAARAARAAASDRAPFAGLKKAPWRYWQEWEAAEVLKPGSHPGLVVRVTRA